MGSNRYTEEFKPETSEVVLLHVIYQDVTESKAEYIGWGVDTQLTRANGFTSHIYFFKFSA